MAHAIIDSKNYTDTEFLNTCQKLPGVQVHHMGFGEFYATTPHGRVDFARTDGTGLEIPGQSGRCHLTDGPGAAWLIEQVQAPAFQAARQAERDAIAADYAPGGRYHRATRPADTDADPPAGIRKL